MSERAVFLDRDDTLIVDTGYINDPDQVALIDGVAEALIQFDSLGFKLVVVSNQSAVARGIVTEKKLGLIHDRLKLLLAEKGAALHAIYYCPYHPEGSVPRYCKESDWRKPAPGMILAAAEEMDIDVAASWMIGNSARDVEAGRRAGCKTILVDPPTHEPRSEDLQSNPDYRAINIKEALNIVKHHARVASKHAEQPQLSNSAESDPTPAKQEQSAENPARQSETFDVEPAPPKQQPKTQRIVFSPTSEADPATEPTAETQVVAVEPVHPIRKSRLDSAVRPLRQPPKGRSGDPHPSLDKTTAIDETTRNLLTEILEQLKILNRTEMFDEFSAMRFLAGIVQVMSVFCLVVTAWFLLNPTEKGSEIFIAIGFAGVLQLMSLTFYMMQGRK